MIKIKIKDFMDKKDKELIEMRNKMKLHLMSVTIGKGFNKKEERKNLARINTILMERKNG